MDYVPVEMDEDDEATTDTTLKETIEDYVPSVFDIISFCCTN